MLSSPFPPPEATERRFLGLLGPLLPEGTGRRLVAEAFHCALKGPMVVEEKTLVELHGFQAVSGRGGEPWCPGGVCWRPSSPASRGSGSGARC